MRSGATSRGKPTVFVKEADAELARRCEARGIRPEFRPGLTLSWWERGANARPRRAPEVGVPRIEGDFKAGKQLVEHWMADKLTALIAGGLTSGEAKAFLDSLPSAESLLPQVRVTPELDAAPASTRALGSPRPEVSVCGRARFTR